MDLIEQLSNEIKNGVEGKTNFIPIGLPKLGQWANLRKNIMMLIFSTSGAGKSAIIDTIILNSCLHHMKNGGAQPNFQLFSMERAGKLRIAKWLSAIIFIEEGIEIQLPKMLGWWETKLNTTELDLIAQYTPLIETILKNYVSIHEGAKSPKEMYRIMKDFYESIGKYETIEIDGKTKKVYKQNDDNVITIPIIDHGNLTKTSQELNTKKLAIDKACSMYQGFRDSENSCVLWVAQCNRSISGVTRQKDSEQELTLEDVAESSDIGQACDLAVSLWDPLKYKQSSKTGYDPVDFVDKSNGNNYFRSAQIIKSSYGQDQVRVPLAFLGFAGVFKELPKRSELDERQYKQLIDDVLSKQYFLK